MYQSRATTTSGKKLLRSSAITETPLTSFDHFILNMTASCLSNETGRIFKSSGCWKGSIIVDYEVFLKISLGSKSRSQIINNTQLTEKMRTLIRNDNDTIGPFQCSPSSVKFESFHVKEKEKEKKRKRKRKEKKKKLLLLTGIESHPSLQTRHAII
ncbi:hypothetical protein GQR58_002391 [Nymphon striatum]|nr:hypothetical protein GQR58_002391 [Nymphon striatum]